MAANKLTADEGVELRYFWALGASRVDLAKAYGISYVAVHAHTNGRVAREKYRKEYYKKESEHVKAQRKAWQQSPKGKLSKKKDGLKRAYGITLVDYEIKSAEQSGCCAICGQHYSLFKKGLHLDRNHKTGKICGLLCPTCNTNLIASLESPLLEKARLYLQGRA